MSEQDPRVQAIRKDELVGEGSCSPIDETYTDEELVEALDRVKAKTIPEALAWATMVHGIWVDQMEDAKVEGAW